MSSLQFAISARGITQHFSGPNTFIRSFIHAWLEQVEEHTLHIYYDDDKALGLFPKAYEHVLNSKNRRNNTKI